MVRYVVTLPASIEHSRFFVIDDDDFDRASALFMAVVAALFWPGLLFYYLWVAVARRAYPADKTRQEDAAR